MRRSGQGVAIGLLLAIGTALGGLPGLAQPVDTARIASGSPNDWLSYRGAYNGWNYSGLDQISTGNVKDLAPGFMCPAARRAACNRYRWSLTAFSTTPVRTVASLRSMAPPVR